MRENEFEKKVKEKMDEFNLSPSAQVWADVERRIRKEKKRRFIFWWPLLFLLAGGGITAGILLVNNNKEKANVVAINKNPVKPVQSSPKKTISPASGKPVPNTNGDKIAGTKPVNNKTGDNNVQTKSSSGQTKRVAEKTKTPSGRINTSSPGNWSVENKVSVIKKKRPISRDTKKEVPATADKKKDQDKNQINEPAVTITSPAKQTEPVAEQTRIAEVAIQPNELPKEDKQPGKLAEPATDSVTREEKTKSPLKDSKKWEWGLTVSGGRSAVVNGFGLFKNMLYADALSPQGPGPASIYTRGSTIRPFINLSAGVYFKRALGKKVDLNLGAGYSFLSTKMNVGAKVDSPRTITTYNSGTIAVNGYYRSGSGSKQYINQYHFLSLSAELSWKIISGKNFSLSWDNGISYNRLLASSMLHFSNNLPGYYKDNRLLVKDQLFLTTGISLPLSQRVWISPFASYGLTTVLKQSGNESTHYMQYGIRLKFQLKKK